MRVLVVEDDDRVARGLCRALLREGYRVVRAADLAEAAALVAEQLPDLALVDMGLPDGHGSELVRRLRVHPAIGILVVTAQGEESDRVVGLRAGADDYVVKPFSLAELMARIEAVSRRTRPLRQQVDPTPTVLACPGLEVDTAARVVRGTGEDPWQVALTQTQCAILGHLVARAGQAVERAYLLDQVWEAPSESSSRSLDTHVAALRARLGERVSIRTVRGVGYVLQPED
ncbi:response regulator transcription factor [Nocardioides zeae]|uniref:Response regulator transcription factor n=1 Tax=Nocardioides imazamoxiresistens TaxID=3231893 RepID=A0ABU3PUH8_9ACTN|nr:response regulator transcription factor [Nocardioides zeae]MDT9592885.1 response regulator transcription factor [Nocardioides zeae]